MTIAELLKEKNQNLDNKAANEKKIDILQKIKVKNSFLILQFKNYFSVNFVLEYLLMINKNEL